MQLAKKTSNKVILLFLISITFFLFLTVYLRAKKNYHFVGLNDGRIQEKIELIEKLEDLNILKLCDKPHDNNFKPFMSVKTSDVYINVNEKDKSVTFCILK